MGSRSHIGPVVELDAGLVEKVTSRSHVLTDDDGVEHLVWGGTMQHGRIPVINHRSLTYRVAKVVWNMEVGVPIGRLHRQTGTCKVQACVLPDHYADDARRAERAVQGRETAVSLRAQVAALTTEVEELEERLFEHDVRRSGTIIRPDPAEDVYVLYSQRVDLPKALFYSREQALAYPVARAKLRRADETGTSDMSGIFGWADPDPTVGIDQMGSVGLKNLVEFTHLYLREDEKCWRLVHKSE